MCFLLSGKPAITASVGNSHLSVLADQIQLWHLCRKVIKTEKCHWYYPVWYVEGDDKIIISATIKNNTCFVSYWTQGEVSYCSHVLRQNETGFRFELFCFCHRPMDIIWSKRKKHIGTLCCRFNQSVVGQASLMANIHLRLGRQWFLQSQRALQHHYNILCP